MWGLSKRLSMRWRREHELTEERIYPILRQFGIIFMHSDDDEFKS